jgi:energy-coupling factor transporter ATP-binding protein EcfA2
MKIGAFEYQDVVQPGWRFSKTNLKAVNLFVGATGSGKTRWLNNLFEIGVFVTQGNVFKAGKWTLEIVGSESTYIWDFESGTDSLGKGIVALEKIIQKHNDGAEEMLVDRRDGIFRYKNSELPKLSPDTPAIHLLRLEDDLAPLHILFSHMIRRAFSEVSLKELMAYARVENVHLEKIKQDKTFEQFYLSQPTLSMRLYYLKEFFKTEYDRLCSFYMSVFPNIEHCDVVDAKTIVENVPMPGLVPVFAIKERNVNKKIGLQELSSGMQKVLLIMADIISLPNDCIYLIDEYENSLGVNAIDFLPSFIADYGHDKQFIITTHHPYLINNMPVSNWQIFHRIGSHVGIKSGDDYVEKFGKSKQKAFIQLINDQFYAQGAQ